MSKIIIITRDGEYTGNETLVEKMSAKQECPSCCFCGFESFYSYFYRENEQGKYTVDLKLLRQKLVDLKLPVDIIRNIIYKRDWFNGEENPLSLSIDDSLTDVLKSNVDEAAESGNNQCHYMDKIGLDNNNEVYLFYWNRTKKIVTETWRMLALICKDCGIDFANSEEEENMLYIHDNEWGTSGNEVLILDRIIKSEANKDLLALLKKKFSYVVSFQHNNVEGMFFWDILHCNFGKNPTISNLLGEKEMDSTTFGSLREACINVLLNK